MVLQQFLRHLPHVGMQRDRRLRHEGCGGWGDILNAARPLAGIDVFAWDEICRACEQSLRALEADHAEYFTSRFPPLEHWRVLAHWFGDVSYFDIETSGLDISSTVTLICCFHRGTPLRFLAGENMEDFLDLLEQVKVLVSFNGASFDVPRVLDRFHIPGLPCAHVDLRWLCYQLGWRGGLKTIESALGFCRPPDLAGLGGAEAVELWREWSEQGNTHAKRMLERYCVADTLMLNLLAGRLLTQHGVSVASPNEAELWGRVSDAFPAERLPSVMSPASPRTGIPLSRQPHDPVIAADHFSIAEMVGAVHGLSRAEKQARLRARWRQMRNGGS